ncbi:MAG: 30S ribosome-binding factor RbfA [Alphaproteobacteria bacterium]
MKRHRSKNSEPSQRQCRVGEQIRHIISETLKRGHFDDELLFEKAETVSVSEVRPSPDLKQAKAYVTSFNSEHLDELIEALNEQNQVFQKEIARTTNLKFTPKIKFVPDTSFDEAQHIENILRNVRSTDSEDTFEN